MRFTDTGKMDWTVRRLKQGLGLDCHKPGHIMGYLKLEEAGEGSNPGCSGGNMVLLTP
jgi:hypothetical protein